MPATGSVTVIVVPAPPSLRMAMLPPLRPNSSRQTQRPMPMPGSAASRAAARQSSTAAKISDSLPFSSKSVSPPPSSLYDFAWASSVR